MDNKYNDAIDELSEHIRTDKNDESVYDKELDALHDCLDIIKERQDEYSCAIFLAPKHKDRLKKDFDKCVSNVMSEQEKDQIHHEWNMSSPLESKVKIIKDVIINECRSILKDAGIGILRINIFIPLLTKYLKTVDLRNRIEKANDAVELQSAKNIIEHLDLDRLS